VAGMFKVNTSLIRYWENEFDILDPRKNRKGDRFFKPSDVKNLQLIHDLLRRRKFTIEGAKDYLKKNKQAQARFELIHSMQRLRGFLLELKANL
jgi:DNA-binding transcriptional MerR regulator